MTRWLSGIVVMFLGILPSAGLAQEAWSQTGFQNTGYLGSPQTGVAPAGHWGGAHYNPHDGSAYAQLRPQSRPGLFSPDSRLGSYSQSVLSQGWVRFDVLSWKIKGADSTLVGAAVAPDVSGIPFDLTGTDRTRRLQALDRVVGARPQTFAVVPTIGDAEENNLTGFRGSFGIPTTFGDFEGSGFVLEEYNESVRVDPFVDSFSIPAETLIGAVSLLNAGAVNNDTMILFSEGLNVSLTTNLYGFETNFVKHAFTPNVGLQIRPLAGIRYINMEEKFQISGTDLPDPINQPGFILNHRIDSNAQNQILGPQIGFRVESDHQRFTLGTELKLLLGFNRVQDRVATQQIFSMMEEPTSDTDENTRFSPVLDFSVYGRLKATEHINFLISYEALVGSGFSRAYDNIYYNAPGPVTDPPLITTQNQLSNFYAHGLVVGVEIIFP